MSRLAGLKAIVTGASSGIGAATARLFAKEGAHVCATGRNTQALDALVEDINGSGGNAFAVPGDVTQDADVANVVETATKAFDGSLDILINNAGVLKGGATDAVDMNNWDFNFQVNARAPFCFITKCVPFLKMSNAGAIVNVSSVNGLQSFGGCVSYCASKAAVDMVTRCASVDLAKFGIRVNSVNPGVVITELQKRGGMDEEAYAAFLQHSVNVTHPLAEAYGRCASPDEVASTILFLASDASSFVTGTCVKIDGGRGNLGAR